jgi:hypothetical protein
VGEGRRRQPSAMSANIAAQLLGNGGKMEPYTIIIMAQWFDTKPGCHNYFCKKKFILKEMRTIQGISSKIM